MIELACGTEFDPSKIASFVASASSETQIKEVGTNIEKKVFKTHISIQYVDAMDGCHC